MNTMFPPDKGTYILILRLNEPARLTIGKLGEFSFATGWYAYAGSAFGSGGLRGRLIHHLMPVTKPHWHIDYLRAVAPVREVWYRADDSRFEHQWASLLCSLPGAVIAVQRFGASDCTCLSHLIYFADKPDFASYCDLTGVTMQRWHVDD